MAARQLLKAWRNTVGQTGPVRVLTLCVGAYFGVRLCQVIVGPLIPAILGTYGVSRGSIGLALTGMWLVYALAQVPSGLFADRFGERAVVLTALVTTAGATVGMAIAPTFAGFVLAVATVGVGAGVYYNPATALLDRTAGAVGRAIGIHRIGGQAAGIVAPAVVTVVGLGYGWRETVFFAAVSVFVVGVAFRVGVRSTEPRRGSVSVRELFDTRQLLALLTRRHTVTTTLVMALVEFAGLATMAFLPVLLIEHHGVPDRLANLLFGAFFATTTVSQPLAGWASDQYHRDRVIVGLALLGVVGFVGLWVGGPVYLIGGATASAGVSMSLTPVVQSKMLDGLATGERGSGFGVFRTVYLLIGATGTAVVGTIADLADWGIAFGVLSGCFVGITVVILVDGR